MNPRGRMSASDRRWQERYRAVQERKWNPPSGREARRRERRRAEATREVTPVESERLDYGVVAARGNQRIAWEPIYEWYDNASYVEGPQQPEFYFNKFVDWFVDDSPSRVKDLKDDVNRWDASGLSVLFA